MNCVKLALGKRATLKKEKRKYNTGKSTKEDMTELLKEEFAHARKFESSLLEILGKLADTKKTSPAKPVKHEPAICDNFVDSNIDF